MTDFAAVHGRLREIILRNRGDLAVTKDGPGGMALEVPATAEALAATRR